MENPRIDRSIRRIVTCDKKWIYFNKKDKQRQWLRRTGWTTRSVLVEIGNVVCLVEIQKRHTW